MTKILLLSDTHGYLDDAIMRHVQAVDEVWHAGDIGDVSVARKLDEEGKLRAVYGNIDDHQLRAQYPLDNRFVCEGVDVWITHIGGYPGRYEQRVKKEVRDNTPDLFISGHSHILKVMRDDKLGLLHMNPGAIGKHGFHKVRTMLSFTMDNGRIADLQVVEYPR